MTDLTQESISDLARTIAADWKPPNYAAAPYLEAMFSLESISDDYGLDSGDMIVSYFLGNATTWRGVTARAVKAELKRRLK